MKTLARPTTDLVHPDEPALSLREINLVKAPIHQWHRYQIITVNRGDRLTEWWKDLGPKSEAIEFEVPSLWEHTVGELWEIADQLRLQDDLWQQRSLELAGESTLIRDFANMREENAKIIHNRSLFGARFRKQRIGFPRKAAIEHGRH